MKYLEGKTSWVQNLGIAGQNLGIFVEKAQTPEFQASVSENLGKLGADIQKYPVYYGASAAFEIGTLMIPVSKISLGAKISTQVLKIGVTGTKGQKLTAMKQAVQNVRYADELKTLSTIKQVFADATVTMKKGNKITVSKYNNYGLFLGEKKL